MYIAIESEHSLTGSRESVDLTEYVIKVHFESGSESARERAQCFVFSAHLHWNSATFPCFDGRRSQVPDFQSKHSCA